MPLDHFDDSGTLAHSSTTDAVNNPTTIGFGPAWRRYLLAGLYNSDFISPPADTGSIIDNNANALPYWNFINQSGSSVTMQSVADTTLPSGRRLDVTMGAGAAADISLIRQFTPIPTSAAQVFRYEPVLTSKTGSAVNLIELYVAYSFYKVDGVTQTGSTSSVTKATNAVGASTVSDLFVVAPPLMPADAYYMACDFGLHRGAGAAVTDTVTVSFLETRAAGTNSFRRVAVPSGVQQLVAATAILANAEVVLIQTSGAPITLTSAPTVADGADGQILTIVNVDNNNAITVQDQGTLPSSNLRLSAATIALGPRDNLTLVFSALIGDWIQVGTTNVL